MRVDYILATHLQCRPRSDRVKAALAEGLVVLRDADGAEHTIRDGTFQVVVGAETLTCDGTALPRPFQRLLAVHKKADGTVDDAIGALAEQGASGEAAQGPEEHLSAVWNPRMSISAGGSLSTSVTWPKPKEM